MSVGVKIAFIGQKQSGKSTASDFVANIVGGVSVDTSARIYRELAEELGTTVEELKSRPKESIRQRLIEKGDMISLEHPLALIADQLDARAYCIAGIRKRDQLEALPDEVKVVWIEREGHNPPGEDNLELTAEDADYVVTNNGEKLGPFHAALLDLIEPWL